MAGLSKARLGRLHHVLSGWVERRELAGLVAFVGAGGDEHVEALGAMALDAPTPMRADALFRLASITKPVTAAAAMILIEECRIGLDDSVEPWLPELAQRRVLKCLSSEPYDTVPARRAITVRDLLTLCMGFGSLVAPDRTQIQKLIRERIGGEGPCLPSERVAADEWLEGLGALPWMAQPGDRWMYRMSSDVLGILIARVAGQSLGDFMRERLFDPLGMKDTGFHVPAPKLDRLPGFYFMDETSGALAPFDDPDHSAWSAPPRFESGGSGLVSTVEDYVAFLRMLLHRGRHGSEQILSRGAVDLMTTDQVTAEQRAGAEAFFGGHSSWGFGLAVDTRREQSFHNPGRYGWTSSFGTSAYVDPNEGLITVILTQRLMESPQPPRWLNDFWTLASWSMD